MISELPVEWELKMPSVHMSPSCISMMDIYSYDDSCKIEEHHDSILKKGKEGDNMIRR